MKKQMKWTVVGRKGATALLLGSALLGSQSAYAGYDESVASASSSMSTNTTGQMTYMQTSTTMSSLQMPALMGRPNAQMQAVLNELKALKPKPIERLSPAQARLQPGPPDAVINRLLKLGRSTAPERVARIRDTFVPGPAGRIPVRVYYPVGVSSERLPVISYMHGGGWVIASIKAYDASARALANASRAMVVSIDYRMAPEHKLPAAHEDSYAATQWLLRNAAQWGGDPNRVAVAGESAGGNLATAVCLMAKMRGGRMPIHQLLVYPITQYGNFNTQSYREHANAKPLNRAMMRWFFRHALRTPSQGYSPLISPLRADVRGLPPATIVLAEIDPLRSEGAMYANHLRAAGVPVNLRLYTAVTHEFFGMGAVVDKARDAVAFASADLRQAFAR